MVPLFLAPEQLTEASTSKLYLQPHADSLMRKLQEDSDTESFKRCFPEIQADGKQGGRETSPFSFHHSCYSVALMGRALQGTCSNVVGLSPALHTLPHGSFEDY